MSDETTKTKIIVIEDECTIYDVSDLKERVMEHISNGMDITFDLSQVSQIDASVIQLLISIKKELTLKGLKFNLGKCSSRVNDFIKNIFCDEALLVSGEDPFNS